MDQRVRDVVKKITGKVLVIGIGARHRGDDELGLLVIDSLTHRNDLQGVRFAGHSDDPARIISEWENEDAVIVVDAVRTGDVPGTLHRIDVNSTSVTPQSRQSSHGNALADAIELSRALGTLPARLIVVGMEPLATDLGDDMSPQCKNALPELMERLVEEIRCMSHR